MYVDGLIGNQGLLEVLGGLTAGIYNYIRTPNSPPYKLQDTIPRAYEYIYPPLSAEQQHEKTQQTLKSFMYMKAPKGMFKDKV